MTEVKNGLLTQPVEQKNYLETALWGADSAHPVIMRFSSRTAFLNVVFFSKKNFLFPNRPKRSKPFSSNRENGVLTGGRNMFSTAGGEKRNYGEMTESHYRPAPPVKPCLARSWNTLKVLNNAIFLGFMRKIFFSDALFNCSNNQLCAMDSLQRQLRFFTPPSELP